MGTDVLSLIIFGICIIFFIINKVPKSLVALIGLIIMVTFNVVSFGDAFKNFAGKTTILVLSIMIIGKAINDTGVSAFISQSILKLPFKSEKTLVVIATLLTAILSSFIDNQVVYLLVFSTIEYICVEKKDNNLLNFVLPIGIAAVIGSTLTLTGGHVLPTASGILEEYIGKEFKFFTVSGVSIIINFILVLYVGIIGYSIGKKIWNTRMQNTVKNNNYITDKTVKSRKKNIMIFILIITVLAFTFSNKISYLIPNMNVATISVISAILCILFGCVNYKDAIKSIDLDAIIWIGATLGITGALIESGGSKIMADFILKNVGSDISPIMLYVVFIIFTTLLTQFFTNTATISLILPIMCSITIARGFNTYSFAIGVTLAGTLGITTPFANNIMTLVSTSNYKFSDFIKYCLPVTVIETIALITVVPIIYPLV